MTEIYKNDTIKTSDRTESSGFSPMSDSDKEKQRKSRKQELIAAAIGDGISSLSNLFFASKGAPIAKSYGKNQRQPTLIERIYGRHKEEDTAYKNQLTAWEDDEKKKQKEAEKNARENIHAEFKPLKSHWNDKEYIGQMYEDLLGEIGARNNSKGLSTSKLEDILNYQTKNVSSRVLPYLQQSILYDVLDGRLESFDDESKKELDEEFLKYFRNKWADNDSGWVKMK